MKEIKELAHKKMETIGEKTAVKENANKKANWASGNCTKKPLKADVLGYNVGSTEVDESHQRSLERLRNGNRSWR